jgi:hypothetical protein
MRWLVIPATILAAACEKVDIDEVLDPSPPSGWRVELVARIGGSGDGVGSAFGRVHEVTSDAVGRNYVLDRDLGRVTVLDRDGRFLQNIGGGVRGSGPGEMRNPTGVVWSDAGFLWVLDLGNARYSVYDSIGGLYGTFPRLTGSRAVRWSAVAGESGRIYEPASIRSGDVSGLRRAFLALELRGDRVVPIDTIWRFDAVPDVPRWEIPASPAADGTIQSGFFPVPFYPLRRDVVDPRGGYWTGRTDSLRFSRIDHAGDTVQVISLSEAAAARRVSAAHRVVVAEEIAERFGPHVQVDLSQMPSVLPLWNDFVIDDKGRLWVQRFRDPEITGHSTHTWYVISSSGDYLGAVQLDLEAEPRPSIRGDRIVGLAYGPHGTMDVVIYQIVEK